MQDDLSIWVKDLSKHFGQFKAVDRISFEVRKGEVFGFLGANGAGKTTAMRMLCGLLEPTAGEGLVAGYDIRHERERIKRRIGYMSQRFSLYNDLTVAENITFYGGIYGLSRSDIREKRLDVLQKLGLEQLSGSLVRSLPLGWKQKIALSVAMLHQPGIIFLDEPTGGVDPVTRRDFWEMIRQSSALGTTVFVTTHYMDEAEYCDRISMMVDGRIEGMGTPQELKSRFESADMNEVFLKLARK